MRRAVAVVGVATLLVGGYAALDAVDAAPGVLTTRPQPPPPPTETAGTRTLPVVPQPSPSTSVGMPLSSLAPDELAPSPAVVAKALAPVLEDPALREASLLVRDGQTGQVLLDRAGAQPRIPASTTKLLTAAAVLQEVDPDLTLRTEVRRVGSTPGRIALVAGGDTLLAPGPGNPDAVAGRAGLADLADQVVASLAVEGTKAVTLSVDLSYAPGPLLAPTWSPTYRPEGITGAVAMLGLASQRALPGRPGPADPVASTRDRFAALLRERGIAVTPAAAPPTAEPTPDATTPTTVLGVVESAPVRDLLALALIESDNALTEVLARQAAHRAGAPTDFAAVGAWVVAQLQALGVDTTGVSLVDASGLSRESRATVRVLTDVLVLAHDGSHPGLRPLLEGLPVAGLEGTLATRFDTGATDAAAGRAHAKTGTLTGANGLAGSVVDDDGRLLVYAGLVAGAPTPAAQAALDRVVTTLTGCGCQ